MHPTHKVLVVCILICISLILIPFLLSNDQKRELGCFIPTYYTGNVSVNIIVMDFWNYNYAIGLNIIAYHLFLITAIHIDHFGRCSSLHK